MNYYLSITINGDFESVESKVKSLLNNEGFGILTEIDMRKTLKEKLNVDFRSYKILGACHPPSAFIALGAEDKIGTLLPCNVIIQEFKRGSIEISAINPLVSMQVINNKIIGNVAKEVTLKLKNVINNLKNEK